MNAYSKLSNTYFIIFVGFVRYSVSNRCWLLRGTVQWKSHQTTSVSLRDRKLSCLVLFFPPLHLARKAVVDDTSGGQGFSWHGPTTQICVVLWYPWGFDGSSFFEGPLRWWPDQPRIFLGVFDRPIVHNSSFLLFSGAWDNLQASTSLQKYWENTPFLSLLMLRSWQQKKCFSCVLFKHCSSLFYSTLYIFGVVPPFTEFTTKINKTAHSRKLWFYNTARHVG